MSEFATLVLNIDGPVAIVSLNRPETLNAFNDQMRSELLSVIRRVNRDDNIRVAILTGEGRGFSAGADLVELNGPFDTSTDLFEAHFKPMLMAIYNAPKPWISAVSGAAAGVASALAMTCDLTVMADNAYLCLAFAAIGLIPDGGATWHLAHGIGRKRAYEMIISGAKMPADQCLQLGLCNRVVPVEKLREEALNWARELAQQAPFALRYAKQALNEAMTESLDTMITREINLQEICAATDDFSEGVNAFLEKRPPQFTGK